MLRPIAHQTAPVEAAERLIGRGGLVVFVGFLDRLPAAVHRLHDRHGDRCRLRDLAELQVVSMHPPGVRPAGAPVDDGCPVGGMSD